MRFPERALLKAELKAELSTEPKGLLESWSLLLVPVEAIEAARAAEEVFKLEAKLLVKPANYLENELARLPANPP